VDQISCRSGSPQGVLGDRCDDSGHVGDVHDQVRHGIFERVRIAMHDDERKALVHLRCVHVAPKFRTIAGISGYARAAQQKGGSRTRHTKIFAHRPHCIAMIREGRVNTASHDSR
jgi:hypothetical protein